MKIKCTRPVLTPDGVSEIKFYFDTETLELSFDEKDLLLLVDIYRNRALDISELTDYEKID